MTLADIVEAFRNEGIPDPELTIALRLLDRVAQSDDGLPEVRTD